MSMKKQLVIVEKNLSLDFEKECNILLAQGYILQSSSCAFINSNDYNFVSVWMAIFLLKEDMS